MIGVLLNSLWMGVLYCMPWVTLALVIAIVIICGGLAVTASHILEDQMQMKRTLEELSYTIKDIHKALKDYELQTEMLQKKKNMQTSAIPSVRHHEQANADINWWITQVRKAMEGSAEDQSALRRKIGQITDAHIVDFADKRQRLNSDHYAEFADSNIGGCLLIPSGDDERNYYAFPLASNVEWFRRHADVLHIVFDIQGDSANANVRMVLEQPGIMRKKDTGLESGPRVIYEVADKGKIRCS